MSDDLTVEPMLAESWEFVDDGGALEMHLRDDVTFQNGSPLTAEDARQSILRAIEYEDSTVAATLSSVADVVAVDDLTLRIELTPGTGAELPAVLATSAGIVISHEALEAGTDLSTDSAGAGSGPYMLEELVQNESTTFVPRPDGHWDETAGRLDRLELIYIPANISRINGIVSGEIDVAQISVPDVDEAVALIEAGELQGRLVETLTQYTVLMDSSEAPFDDPAVRQAMIASIDRNAIGDDLLEGYCRPTAQAFPPASAVHNPAIEEDSSQQFDLDSAEDLLADAETQSPSFEIVYIAGTAYETIATAVHSWWADLGIDDVLVPKPAAEVLPGFRADEHDAIYNSFIAKAHPALTVTEYYLGGANLVPADAAERAELEELAARGIDPTVDESERDEAYQEFWQIVADASYGIPVCFADQMWLYDEDVAGVEDTKWLWTGSPDARHLATRG